MRQALPERAEANQPSVRNGLRRATKRATTPPAGLPLLPLDEPAAEEEYRAQRSRLSGESRRRSLDLQAIKRAARAAMAECITKLSEIERLQADLLRMQVEARPSVGIMTLEADESGPAPIEMVAVGYGLKPDGNYSAQIRVRTGKGEPYQRAMELAKVAEQRGFEASLLVIEEARVPTFKDIENSQPNLHMVDRDRFLHLGMSIGQAEGKPGSLGAFVYLNGRLGIISASHVLARSGADRVRLVVHQPGAGDVAALGPKTRIGVLEDYTVLTYRNTNRIDAAIAILDDDKHPSLAMGGHNVLPAGFGCPVEGKKLAGCEDARLVPLGSRVGKFGRTTGYTEGTVTAVAVGPLAITNNAVTGTKIPFSDLIEITWDEMGKGYHPFSSPGDSGSVVFTLDPLRAVGLHIVGGRREDGCGVSYACHLSVRPGRSCSG